jgi:hypothetical protein
MPRFDFCYSLDRIVGAHLLQSTNAPVFLDGYPIQVGLIMTGFHLTPET